MRGQDLLELVATILRKFGDVLRRLPIPAQGEQQAEQVEAHLLLPAQRVPVLLLPNRFANLQHPGPYRLAPHAGALTGRDGEGVQPGRAGEGGLPQEFGQEDHRNHAIATGTQGAHSMHLPPGRQPDVSRVYGQGDFREETLFCPDSMIPISRPSCTL